MKIALALALALTAAACGDDAGAKPDGPVQPDAMPDAPPANPTLTSYVVDLITHNTSDLTQPRPFSEFATLPDPDGDANNTSAYAMLFP